MNDNSNKATKDVFPPTSAASTGQAELADDGLLEQLRADLDAAKERCFAVRRNWRTIANGATREIDENRRYAELPLMRDPLPVLDNVERAIAAADQTQDVAVLLNGIKLVARQFEDIFPRHHCQRIGRLALAIRSPFAPRDLATAQQRIPAEHGAYRGPARLSVV